MKNLLYQIFLITWSLATVCCIAYGDSEEKSLSELIKEAEKVPKIQAEQATGEKLSTSTVIERILWPKESVVSYSNKKLSRVILGTEMKYAGVNWPKNTEFNRITDEGSKNFWLITSPIEVNAFGTKIPANSYFSVEQDEIVSVVIADSIDLPWGKVPKDSKVNFLKGTVDSVILSANTEINGKSFPTKTKIELNDNFSIKKIE